jgi:hypothetical protein
MIELMARRHYRTRSHLHRLRALTLVEVLIASGVLALVVVGVLGALVQSRRLTEGSIYQNAAITVVQGYLEQIKEADFANVPYYNGSSLIAGNSNDPIAGVASANRSKAIKTLLNNTDVDTVGNADGETISDFLLISSGNPPTLSSITPGGTAPSGVEDNVKLVDVNQTTSKSDDLRLRIWVWVKDASAAGHDATQVRSITIIYHWAMNDGTKTKWFVGSVRSLRSAVPTV